MAKSLLFNMLSSLVITFLPRSKCLLISWLQSPSAVILEPKEIKSATVSTVSPSICHEVMANRVLPREHTGHTKHPLPTTQEKTLHMDITRWSTIDYILCSQRWRSSIQSAKIRPEADCGSDHELLIAKVSLKLKKVGKTTRPFRYDLNQIPYVYTVEVTNRFKVLDLLECLVNYGQRFVTLYRRQGLRPSPRKRSSPALAQKALLCLEAETNAFQGPAHM